MEQKSIFFISVTALALFASLAQAQAQPPTAQAAAKPVIDSKAMAVLQQNQDALQSLSGVRGNSVEESSNPKTVFTDQFQFAHPDYEKIVSSDDDESDPPSATNPWKNTVIANASRHASLMTSVSQYDMRTGPASGKGLEYFNDTPFAGFFERSRSYLGRVEKLRQDGTLISLEQPGDETWHGKKYQVVQWISSANELDFSADPQNPRVVTRIDLDSNHFVHRVVVTQGSLSETKTLLNYQLNPAFHAADYTITIPAKYTLYAPPAPQPATNGVEPSGTAETGTLYTKKR